jgi:hypothetical protein
MQAANTYNGDTVVGGGTLIVNGSLQSPLTTVNNEALLGGSGLLQGVLLNGGTISAGNSAGLLSMNNLDASNGNFIFELGVPSSRGITYDAIDVSSLLTLGTDTDFTFETLNNYAFADGDTYDLFNWGSADMTNFNVSALEAALPSLASTPDLSWNVSQFTLDGTVSVSSVPEPSTGSLMAFAVASLITLKVIRRKKCQRQTHS